MNGLQDINILYIFQGYNRPHFLAPSMLSIRNQIISRNRPVKLFLDCPNNVADENKVEIQKLLFESIFKDYYQKEVIIEPVHLGADWMFIKTFIRAFDELGVDNFALLEDDLYYEKSYVHNVENLITHTYNDEDVVSASGFTRATLCSSDEDLIKNKNVVVSQHNLIGSIYKRNIWTLLRPIFLNIINMLASKKSTSEITIYLNEKYKLYIPWFSYDKVVGHICSINKKLRISTYNRYLYHLGVFGGTSVASENDNFENITNAMKYFMDNLWDRLTTDTEFINTFIFDKTHPSFIESCNVVEKLKLLI